jgi:hypothetical protein
MGYVMKGRYTGAVMPFFFIIILSFLPACAAADNDISIWDRLVTPVWDGNFNSLNTVATDPEFTEIHKTANFGGSCDIVGWRNMSRIDGIDYIYGDPWELVIVAVHTEEYLSGSETRFNDNVDWIKEDIRISINDDNLTAHVNLSMLWHHSKLKHTAAGKKYIDKTYHTDYITGCINDSEIIPLQYDYSAQNISVMVTYYNNSINPKSVIFVPDKLGLYSIEYTYKNESVHENIMKGYVETNSKGIEFVNFSDNTGWTYTEGNMSHIGVCAVVKGANFTLNNLSITAHTPYEQLPISNYNLSTCNLFNGKRSIHYLFVPILFMICSPFILIYFVYKRAGG